MRFENLAQARQRHRAIDEKTQVFIGIHALRQAIDQLAIGFEQQRHQLLLAFQRQVRFGPAIKSVPGMIVAQ